MSTKYLPAVPSWFRLPEYVRDVLARVISLETTTSAGQGVTDTFTTNDGKTVTVQNGIVVSIV